MIVIFPLGKNNTYQDRVQFLQHTCMYVTDDRNDEVSCQLKHSRAGYWKTMLDVYSNLSIVFSSTGA